MRKSGFAFAVSLVVALSTLLAHAGTEVPNGPVHDGTEVTVDLPLTQRVHNKGGTDGSGLCVFATLDMIARYQNIKPLIGIMERMSKEERGGGWPEKVDAMIAKYGLGQQIDIVQYQGVDPAILDLAMKTGRPVGLTYGYGEFYGNQTIAHMVMLVHLDAEKAAILDNNDEKRITWMSRKEFLRRWSWPHNQGWAYVLLAPPPPPAPRN
jgi:hypothetical protein